MSIEKVRKYLAGFGMEDKILEFDVSSATVELAAVALGVEGERIAKTLSFETGEGCMLIVMAGDARLDNSKFKAEFHFKAKMLSAAECAEKTGHAVGGVCPFAVPEDIKVYLDISLRRFSTVFPACGSGNSAIALTCEQLETFSGAFGWIDVCKSWQKSEQ